MSSAFPLLIIVQKAMVLVGLSPQPTTVIGNTDPTIAQMLAFAEQTGRELAERFNWTNLDTAGQVNGDGTTTLFQLPDDWIRFSPSDKSPERGTRVEQHPLIPLVGPVNTEDLNLLKALPASTVRPVWRIIGGALEIWPVLAAGEIVTFNYFSDSWVSKWDRTQFRNYFAKDDDFRCSRRISCFKAWCGVQEREGPRICRGQGTYEASIARNAGQQMTATISTSRKFGDSNMFYGTIVDLTSQ